MPSILEQVNMRDPGAVIDALRRGALANRTAPCRRSSIDIIEVSPDQAGTPAATLIATGDLHDNPLHLARLVRAAGMDPENPTYDIPHPTSHLTLHELIHGDRLINGLDYSYRVLVRAAVLKSTYPDYVHTLLANHEIAQLVGSVVVKDGVKCNEAFDEALAATFPEDADLAAVKAAINDFISSMPLALRIRRKGASDSPSHRLTVSPSHATGDILCSHSLPAPQLMSRFDPPVLERDLTPDDFLPRTGSAYLMTWCRDLVTDHLNALAHRWNTSLFILGHEKAEQGSLVLAPNAIILNSDHAQGVYARLDLTKVSTAQDVADACVPLNEI